MCVCSLMLQHASEDWEVKEFNKKLSRSRQGSDKLCTCVPVTTTRTVHGFMRALMTYGRLADCSQTSGGTFNGYTGEAAHVHSIKACV